MSDRPTLPAYNDAVKRECGGRFYRERHFQTAKRWAELSATGYRGHLNEYDPTLDALLNDRAVVVLGEPGCGKSTTASAAMVKAIDRGEVPVLIPLGEYAGSLAAYVAELPVEFENPGTTRRDSTRSLRIRSSGSRRKSAS
jgi:KaiC/GvpD/RAD55 family RecA-like ATPase